MGIWLSQIGSGGLVELQRVYAKNYYYANSVDPNQPASVGPVLDPNRFTLW